MILRFAHAATRLSLVLLPILTGGCASYWVQYDKQETLFQEGAPQFDKAGDELAVGKIPCNGGLEVQKEQGLFWWPGGFYRHEEDYGIYFKRPAESSRDFYFTMPRYDGWPQVVEATGEVAISRRRVLIDVEYKDERGRWREAPINGTHKIDSVLLDDLASVHREAQRNEPTGTQDGAANGSQPIRSETNSTPLPAGSGR